MQKIISLLFITTFTCLIILLLAYNTNVNSYVYSDAGIHFLFICSLYIVVLFVFAFIFQIPQYWGIPKFLFFILSMAVFGIYLLLIHLIILGLANDNANERIIRPVTILEARCNVVTNKTRSREVYLYTQLILLLKDKSTGKILPFKIGNINSATFSEVTCQGILSEALQDKNGLLHGRSWVLGSINESLETSQIVLRRLPNNNDAPEFSLKYHSKNPLLNQDAY